MPTSAILRKQLEISLSDKTAAALSPRLHTKLVRLPCGIAELDSLLFGGLPIGVLTEFVGVECSGRTTMALAYMAAITQTGSVCAWIDVTDGFEPESAAANGVDLARLLWVRCGSPPHRVPETVDVSQNAAPLLGETFQPRHTGVASPHPRSEGRDMPEAISAMLQAHGGLYDRQVRREAIGTPGAPNRPLVNRSENREEQVNSDRLPARRGDNLAIAQRCAETQPPRMAGRPSSDRMATDIKETQPTIVTARKPWTAIDQALRSADLLLQGGGFSVIVLDLGGTLSEAVWRIPLATWFRFRAACERTRVSLLLLTQHPCARSAAELVVRLETGSMEAEGKVMTGAFYCAATERNRTKASENLVVPIRKPPQSERPGNWKSMAPWSQAK